MRIAVVFDHAGVCFGDVLDEAIREAGQEPVDLGTWEDHPDAAYVAGRAIEAGEVQRAVLACGSGAGVAVAATKLPGIRASIGHDTYTAATFSGEERHVRRLHKIDRLERQGFALEPPTPERMRAP